MLPSRREEFLRTVRDWIHFPVVQWPALGFAIAACVAVVLFYFQEPPAIASTDGAPFHAAPTQDLTPEEIVAIATATIDYKPLSAEDAVKENALIPFATDIAQIAAPLIFRREDSESYARVLDCLTAAIYYEAGNEITQGKLAVAQVILNRVRHPAFPKTVCGVVFQGHERSTGCQFTFTCDGSIRRKPAEQSWNAARMVAESALAGKVEPMVGWATNYHANYVVPYWAPKLAKTAVIGTHIFYRMPGSVGQPGAFSGQSLAVEPLYGPLRQLALARELAAELAAKEAASMAEQAQALEGPPLALAELSVEQFAPVPLIGTPAAHEQTTAAPVDRSLAPPPNRRRGQLPM